MKHKLFIFCFISLFNSHISFAMDNDIPLQPIYKSQQELKKVTLGNHLEKELSTFEQRLENEFSMNGCGIIHHPDGKEEFLNAEAYFKRFPYNLKMILDDPQQLARFAATEKLDNKPCLFHKAIRNLITGEVESKKYKHPSSRIFLTMPKPVQDYVTEQVKNISMQ